MGRAKVHINETQRKRKERVKQEVLASPNNVVVGKIINGGSKCYVFTRENILVVENVVAIQQIYDMDTMLS